MSVLTNIESLLLVTVEPEASPRSAADRSAGEVIGCPAHEDTDHNLLARTRAGDEAAFAQLVARYRSPLTNYINRLLDDRDAAVDLAQETFVRLYQARDRYHAGYAFSTYIYRIATNLAISEMRRRKRRRLVSLTNFFDPRSDAAASGDSRAFDPPDAEPLPDSELLRRERQRAVRRAVASLPENYRVAIVLRDIEGSSYEEIAVVLDASVGTIKSRVSRARALLRQKLADHL